MLDGRWEDAQDFVSPFAAKAPGFDVGKVMFQLKRQKFLELVGGSSARPEVMELVDGLKQLEGHCSKQEFNNLCYCLTLNTLTGEPAVAARGGACHSVVQRSYRGLAQIIPSTGIGIRTLGGCNASKPSGPTLRLFLLGRWVACSLASPCGFSHVVAGVVQWVESEATRQPVPPQQLLRLMAQAATFQTLVQVQAHPDLEPPFHLNFAVDSRTLHSVASSASVAASLKCLCRRAVAARLDASLLRRREVGAVEPAAAVDMCLREWADPRCVVCALACTARGHFACSQVCVCSCCSVTAKPLAGRGNSDPASDGANSLAKSAVAAPWWGAGGGAGMAGYVLR